MKQRRWSIEEKVAIVLEGTRGRESVAEICREHKISQTLYYRSKPKADSPRQYWGIEMTKFMIASVLISKAVLF